MTAARKFAVEMACSGCGAGAVEPYPFRCPRAGDDDEIDHVLTRILEPGARSFPRHPRPGGPKHQGAAESLHFVTPVTGPNPFLEYRDLFYSYHAARTHGSSDADYVHLVEDLNESVARADGHGFVITPFARHSGISDRLGCTRAGGVWIKNETGNVSGSHKGRHLMGIMIYLKVLESIGLDAETLPPLAIASCGNAALAAAVIARAARRPLRVFIPPDAPGAVVDRLVNLQAEQTVCRREPGVPGDPCYLAFRDTVTNGAVPFCCQGNENGLTIEGGATLGYEMISTMAPLDRVVIQVGGGALASSVIQAFGDARALGVIPRLPRFHAVQTRGAYPLARAYARLVDRIRDAGVVPGQSPGSAPGPVAPASPSEHSARAEAATRIAESFSSPGVQRELRYAATHRSEFMWPWEQAPRSIAHGILDDETYDWYAVVTGLLASGGYPVVVDEIALADACELARSSTGIDVDHTGAAGLAGLLELKENGRIAPDENVAVIFSGVRRR